MRPAYHGSDATCKRQMRQLLRYAVAGEEREGSDRIIEVRLVEGDTVLCVTPGLDVGARGRVNAAANHRATFSDIARAAVERRPVSIGDVIDVHVHGRAGDIVETPEEADIVFDASVAFQAEKFLAEWL